MKLRDTIKQITREHLDGNGIVAAQNLGGVGCLNNTFPEDYLYHKGVWELPTSDCSNAGVMCGAALSGRRAMYVVRFGGFTWLNGSYLVNYAAKSKELWNTSCPVFTRVMSCEGRIGPVAGGMHHSMIMRMPGIKVFTPMTPKEYQNVWDYYMSHDEPVFCSEHRSSYDIEQEFQTQDSPINEYIIFAIGAARISADLASIELKKQGIHVGVEHVMNMAVIESYMYKYYYNLKKIYVIDSDYVMCGAASYLAYKLYNKYRHTEVEIMGLECRSAGFSKESDNLTPSYEMIVNKILKDKNKNNKELMENLY